MSGAKFTDEFKRDAVAQVEDRRVISVSAATVSIKETTAARCAAGRVERSMTGAVCMGEAITKPQQKHAKPSG